MVHEAEHRWRQIAARNDWRLADDDPGFVPRVLGELGKRAEDVAVLEQELLHAYRRRLFFLLRQGSERAATELRHTCVVRAHANGLDDDTAADVAQETMRRVLEHVDDLAAPEAIVSWALVIQRRVLRDRAARVTASSLEHGLASGALAEPAVTEDVAATVTDRVALEQLTTMLERVLTKPMERLLIERIVLNGEKPREAARDMGLPVHQIRVHKSRALQRLRANPSFMEAVRQLLIDLDGLVGAKEQTDDVS